MPWVHPKKIKVKINFKRPKKKDKKIELKSSTAKMTDWTLLSLGWSRRASLRRNYLREEALNIQKEPATQKKDIPGSRTSK